MEPRWQKISGSVIMSLEKTIVQVQTNIIGMEVTMEALGEKPEQLEDESNAQYTNRVREYNQLRDTLPKNLDAARNQLRTLMSAYEKAVEGETIVGERAGKIENLEKLFKVDKDD